MRGWMDRGVRKWIPELYRAWMRPCVVVANGDLPHPRCPFLNLGRRSSPLAAAEGGVHGSSGVGSVSQSSRVREGGQKSLPFLVARLATSNGASQRLHVSLPSCRLLGICRLVGDIRVAAEDSIHMGRNSGRNRDTRRARDKSLSHHFLPCTSRWKVARYRMQ